MEKHTLSNGLRVLFSELQNNSEFDLSITYNVGARDEGKDVNGISHFLEHMLFRGTQSFPNSVDLALAMESCGGEANAMTTIENTAFWIKGASTRFEQGLHCFTEMLLHPNYADIEIERSVILQELAEDYNEEGNCIDVDTLVMDTLYKGQGPGLPIVGIRSTVEGISAQNLRDFRNVWHRPDNAVLTLSINRPFSKVLPLLEKTFGAWQQTGNSTGVRQAFPISQFEDEDSIFLQDHNDNQFALRFAFPSLHCTSDKLVNQMFFERVLDDGMSSFLPARIREKRGLVYDISCDSEALSDGGTFDISATVSAENLPPLLDALSSDLKELFEKGISQEDLERVRFRYLFDLQTTSEHKVRLMQRESWNTLVGLDLSLEEEMERVKAVTQKDLMEMARTLFFAPRRAMALVGPKASEFQENIENFYKVLD